MKSIVLYSFTLLLILLFPPASECRTWTLPSLTLPSSYAGPIERPASLVESYDYPKSNAEPEIQQKHNRRTYIVDIVKLPDMPAIPGTGPDTVKFDFYEQKADGKHPTILLIPAMGGIKSDPSTIILARYFALHGFNCAVPHGRKVFGSEICSSEYVESFFRQAMIDNRRILDFLDTQPKVDPDKVGVFAVSLGSLEATQLAGVDSRIKSMVIVLTGGSVADIICNSHDNLLSQPRKRFLQKNNMTREQLHADLEENVKTDTLDFAPYIDARHARMVIAKYDLTIPRTYGDRLWIAMGRPDRITLPTGHYSAILFINPLKKKAVAFFKEDLGVE